MATDIKTINYTGDASKAYLNDNVTKENARKYNDALATLQADIKSGKVTKQEVDQFKANVAQWGMGDAWTENGKTTMNATLSSMGELFDKSGKLTAGDKTTSELTADMTDLANVNAAAVSLLTTTDSEAGATGVMNRAYTDKNHSLDANLQNINDPSFVGTNARTRKALDLYKKAVVGGEPGAIGAAARQVKLAVEEDAKSPDSKFKDSSDKAIGQMLDGAYKQLKGSGAKINTAAGEYNSEFTSNLVKNNAPGYSDYVPADGRSDMNGRG